MLRTFARERPLAPTAQALAEALARLLGLDERLHHAGCSPCLFGNSKRSMQKCFFTVFVAHLSLGANSAQRRGRRPRILPRHAPLLERGAVVAFDLDHVAGARALARSASLVLHVGVRFTREAGDDEHESTRVTTANVASRFIEECGCTGEAIANRLKSRSRVGNALPFRQSAGG